MPLPAIRRMGRRRGEWVSQKTCHQPLWEFAFRTKAGPLHMVACAIGSFVILKAVVEQ